MPLVTVDIFYMTDGDVISPETIELNQEEGSSDMIQLEVPDGAFFFEVKDQIRKKYTRSIEFRSQKRMSMRSTGDSIPTNVPDGFIIQKHETFIVDIARATTLEKNKLEDSSVWTVQPPQTDGDVSMETQEGSTTTKTIQTSLQQSIENTKEWPETPQLPHCKVLIESHCVSSTEKSKKYAISVAKGTSFKQIRRLFAKKGLTVKKQSHRIKTSDQNNTMMAIDDSFVVNDHTELVVECATQQSDLEQEGGKKPDEEEKEKLESLQQVKTEKLLYDIYGKHGQLINDLYEKWPDVEYDGVKTYGDGTIDSAVRSRRYRARRTDGRIEKKKTSIPYNTTEIDIAAKDINETDDPALIKTKFARTSQIRLHFFMHAKDKDLNGKGVVAVACEMFPSILTDISLASFRFQKELESDYELTMESKFKKVPDFEALLKLHCDGINEIAKEKGCCMDYIGQYEGDDDRYRATVQNLYDVIKKLTSSEIMDRSLIFVGSPTATTLDAAILERKRHDGTQPCILMVYGYPQYTYYIYIEGCALRVPGNAFTALHWLYAAHEVFNLEYERNSGAFWRFMDRLAEIQRRRQKFTRADNNLMIWLHLKLKTKKMVSESLASLRDIMDENDENLQPEADIPCSSKSLRRSTTDSSLNAEKPAKQCSTPAMRRRPAPLLTPVTALNKELQKL
uniref:Uncharacterized protein n=1 Tax=Panagrolaimus sp. JU765 TaxID=591449 RepID=A0AC34RMN4_9BILA